MLVVVLKGPVLASMFFIILTNIDNELHYVTYDQDATIKVFVEMITQ